MGNVEFTFSQKMTRKKATEIHNTLNERIRSEFPECAYALQSEYKMGYLSISFFVIKA